MKRQTSSRGFSILEITLAALLMAVFGILWMSWQAGVAREAQKFSRRALLDTVMPQFNQILFSATRLALSCQKQTEVAPASVSIQCVIARSGGVTTSIRFIKFASENALRYQELDSGVWRDVSVIGGEMGVRVQSFTLCDTSEMQAVNPSCTLLPTKMSSQVAFVVSQHVAKLPPVDMTARIFRFEIVVEAVDPAPTTQGIISRYQGMLFVRNPAPGGLYYAWGTK